FQDVEDVAKRAGEIWARKMIQCLAQAPRLWPGGVQQMVGQYIAPWLQATRVAALLALVTHIPGLGQIADDEIEAIVLMSSCRYVLRVHRRCVCACQEIAHELSP